MTESDATTHLITLSGRDRPGLTARIFDALPGAVVDVEQSVVADRLVQLVLLRVDGADPGWREPLHQVAAELGLDIEIADAGTTADRHRAAHTRITVLAAPLPGAVVAAVARAIAGAGGNIERIKRVAGYPVTAVEFTAAGAETAALRAAVAAAARDLAVDVSVQAEGLQKFGRRLVVLDVDSTLIRQEVIELLAEHTGALDQVAEITERAMRGELDFRQSLTERVALLAGTPAGVIDDVRAKVQLTRGARTLCRTLIGLGHEVALVSGGFEEVVRPLADSLGVTLVRANRLEIVDGVLTGRVLGDIVDRAGKAQALREFAAHVGVPLSRTVAIGDGANDLDMMATAGLGVAFNAKPVVRQAADASVNVPFLDSVLFLLGMTREEIESADPELTRPS